MRPQLLLWMVPLMVLGPLLAAMPVHAQHGQERAASLQRTVVPLVHLGPIDAQARSRLYVLQALVENQPLRHGVIVLQSTEGLAEVAWQLIAMMQAMQARAVTLHVVIDQAAAVGVWPALAVRSENLSIRPQATLSGTQGYRDAPADLLAGDPLLVPFTEQDAAALRVMASRNNHPEAFTASLVTPLRRTGNADRHMTRAWSGVRWTRPAHRGVASYSASETVEAGFARELAADAWPQAVAGMMVWTDVMRHREAVVAADALDQLTQMQRILGAYQHDQIARDLRPSQIQAREMARTGPGTTRETVLVTREQTAAELERDRRMMAQYFRALNENLERAADQARQMLRQVDLRQEAAAGDRGRLVLLRQVHALEQPLEFVTRGMSEADEAAMQVYYEQLMARLR